LANDTTLFIKDEKSAIVVLNIIKQFGIYAGTRLNETKTMGMWLGTHKGSEHRITGSNVMFTSKPIKILGIYVGHDKVLTDIENWDNKIDKLETILKLWSGRNLSLAGRILIVKSLGISQLVYLTSNIACPSDRLKKINKILFSFIWNGKTDKVKRTSIIGAKMDGGLGMIDFELLDKSLKLKMLHKIVKSEGQKWSAISNYYLNQFGSNKMVLRSNPLSFVKKGTPGLRKHHVSDFCKSMICAWHALKQMSPESPSSGIKVRKQVIWGNKNIVFNKQPLWFQHWIDSGIVMVNDLFSADGIFDSKLIYNRLHSKRNWVSEMFMIQNALPKDWLTTVNYNGQWSTVIGKQNPTKLYCKGICIDLLQAKCSTKEIYNLFVKHVHTKPLYNSMWEKSITQKINWSDVYKSKLVKVKEVKLIVFNYKLLNNILASSIKLCQWKIYGNSYCHLCFAKGDTVHMILNCPFFENYYNNVKVICTKLGLENIKFDTKTLICGYKSFDSNYENVNYLLNIIFFVVYKTYIITRERRKDIAPLSILKQELYLRLSSENYFVKNFFELM